MLFSYCPWLRGHGPLSASIVFSSREFIKESSNLYYCTLYTPSSLHPHLTRLLHIIILHQPYQQSIRPFIIPTLTWRFHHWPSFQIIPPVTLTFGCVFQLWCEIITFLDPPQQNVQKWRWRRLSCRSRAKHLDSITAKSDRQTSHSQSPPCCELLSSIY